MCLFCVCSCACVCVCVCVLFVFYVCVSITNPPPAERVRSTPSGIDIGHDAELDTLADLQEFSSEFPSVVFASAYTAGSSPSHSERLCGLWAI